MSPAGAVRRLGFPFEAGAERDGSEGSKVGTVPAHFGSFLGLTGR
jgi:hypothetical protein